MKRSSENLVQYSDSDEAEVDASPVAKKRKLPALASSLVPATPVDDPSLHQGRIRTQPHVEGQFAAFVFVSVNVDRGSPLRQLVLEAFNTAREIVPCLQELPDVPLTGDLTHGKCSLHVSLSRPVYLRAHQREELKKAVKNIADRNSPFTASFATFSELTNDEKTRTFLALEIGAGHLELRNMCEALTPTLKSIRQQSFYTEPRFHASFAWALLDLPVQTTEPGLAVETQLDTKSGKIFPSIPHLPHELVPTLNDAFKAKLASSTVTEFLVDKICVKIGKEVACWRLSKL